MVNAGRQPNVEPHDPHRDDGVPGRRDPVFLRRRGHSQLCVRVPGRRHRRHVQHGVHRRARAAVAGRIWRQRIFSGSGNADRRSEARVLAHAQRAPWPKRISGTATAQPTRRQSLPPRASTHGRTSLAAKCACRSRNPRTSRTRLDEENTDCAVSARSMWTVHGRTRSNRIRVGVTWLVTAGVGSILRFARDCNSQAFHCRRLVGGRFWRGSAYGLSPPLIGTLRSLAIVAVASQSRRLPQPIRRAAQLRTQLPDGARLVPDFGADNPYQLRTDCGRHCRQRRQPHRQSDFGIDAALRRRNVSVSEPATHRPPAPTFAPRAKLARRSAAAAGHRIARRRQSCTLTLRLPSHSARSRTAAPTHAARRPIGERAD